MEKWKTQKLVHHCDVTSSKRIYANELVESGVPFLKSKEIIEKVNGLAHSELLFISENRYQQIALQQGSIVAGDILLTSRGTLGVPYVVKFSDKFHFADGNLTWFRNFTNLESSYLKYFFISPLGKAELQKCVIGSSQLAYTISSLKNIEIPLPPLPVQRRIAGILSAYDDLIENNQRRIAVLEKMARSLYREWFVHFRYPGHEGVPLVDSALGPIPQGWEVRKLGEFVKTKYGYTESSNTEKVGPKYLRGMDINKTSFIDWSAVPYCPISSQEFEEYRLQLGDVLVIRMADPGKVGIVEQNVDAVFASYLIRVSPINNRLPPYYLFYLMESAEYYAYVTGASTGTTRKSASAGVVSDYLFVLPPQQLIDKFNERIREIRVLLTSLLQQKDSLRRTRDLLLPRLLSGQLDVGAVE